MLSVDLLALHSTYSIGIAVGRKRQLVILVKGAGSPSSEAEIDIAIRLDACQSGLDMSLAGCVHLSDKPTLVIGTYNQKNHRQSR